MPVESIRIIKSEATPILDYNKFTIRINVNLHSIDPK